MQLIFQSHVQMMLYHIQERYVQKYCNYILLSPVLTWQMKYPSTWVASWCRSEVLAWGINANKQQFITLLDGHLRLYGCRTKHASADADLLIVQTAISTTDIGNKPTFLVADDTDILILLCYHWVRAPRGVYSSSQNLAKLPRSNTGAGICQLSNQHWAQEYVITSFFTCLCQMWYKIICTWLWKISCTLADP